MAGDEQDLEIKNKFSSLLSDAEKFIENSVVLPPEKEQEKKKVQP
jgi:hypothetical protein